MSNKRVIKGTIDVWVSRYSPIGPNELTNTADAELIKGLNFASHDMTTSGWASVGTARVEITLSGAEEIITGRVKALQVTKKQMQADVQMKLNDIDVQIQKLLALTYEPA